MTTIAKNVFNAAGQRFPLFCQYSNESSPQMAFISLDLETGEIDANYKGGINNGVPAPVFYDRVLRFETNPHLMADQINSLINDHLADFQAILDDSEIVWKNSNEVGVFGDKARNLIDSFEYERTLYVENEMFIIEDLEEYLDGNMDIPENQTLIQYAEEIFKSNPDNCEWSDDLNSPEAIADEIINYWHDRVEADDDDIPKHIKKMISDK